MFISFFIALRHMANTYPSFQTGGILWFQDLSIADPTYALPVLCVRVPCKACVSPSFLFAISQTNP